MTFKTAVAEAKNAKADAAAAVIERQPESRTFYHWIDKYPSSEIIGVKGGVSRLASDGSKVREPVLEARFHNGVLTTSDPDVIAAMEKLMRSSPGYTEDREEYYSHVLTADETKRRLANQNSELRAENEQNKEEIGRLRAMLEERGGAKRD